MKNIITFFVNNWRFSSILFILLILLGVASLLTLQRESFPPVDFAKVTITTVYPGSTSLEVEEKITIPIESELRGIEGIKDIKSTSQSELSKIEIRIDIDDPDILTKDVVNDIQRAVDRVQGLPSDILERPKLTEINAKEIPILELALIGNNNQRTRDKEARKLKSLIENTPGVSAVRLVGYLEKEYQVLIDPLKLQKFYVGIPEIKTAISAKTSDLPAGFIRNSEKIQMVRIKAKINSAEELNNTPIRTGDSGVPILLKDLGRATENEEEAKVLTRANGHPATLLVVVKKANADAINTVKNIKKTISEYEKNLNKNIKISIYNNESSRINKRISIVSSNAIQGFFLVLLITFIFLPFKLSIMISLSLPVSLLGTLFFMQQNGANFNLITMLGLIISLGMLVDNSVVVGELYSKNLTQGMSPQTAATEAAHRFWIAILCSVLTTIAAFTPLLVTKGVMGQFIGWIPIIVNISLLLSLFDSYFLLPSRIQFIRLSQKNTNHKTWFNKIESLFELFIKIALQKPLLSSFILLILFISSFFVTIVGNRFELFPKEGVEFYIGRLEMPIQTPIKKTDQALETISIQLSELLKDKGLEVIISRAGIQQAGVGDPLEKNDEHFGMLTIKINPDSAAKQNPDDILTLLKQVKNKDSVSLTFEALGSGPPVGKALNLVLKSDEEEELFSLVNELKNSLSELKGVNSLSTDYVPSGPEILVTSKPSALNYVKLTDQDLGINLRSVYQGLIIGKFYDKGDDFFLRLRFDDSFRSSSSSLEKVKILNQRNLLIPLSPLATFEEKEGPPILRRYDFKRSITLTAETKSDELTSVQLNKEAESRLEDLFKKYKSVSPVFGGEAESTKESVQSLIVALVLAVFGIFGILVFAFNSFIKPLLVISSIPLGLIGINLAFFLHQRPLSFLALIGTIGLAGVIVNSAIILVSALDEGLDNYLKNPTSADKISFLSHVAKERLRPILITSLTTVGGLFPTAYALGGYDATLVPLTLAMGWGLFAGTLLSLFWIPIGYSLILSLTQSTKYNSKN